MEQILKDYQKLIAMCDELHAEQALETIPAKLQALKDHIEPLRKKVRTINWPWGKWDALETLWNYLDHSDNLMQLQYSIEARRHDSMALFKQRKALDEVITRKTLRDLATDLYDYMQDLEYTQKAVEYIIDMELLSDNQGLAEIELFIANQGIVFGSALEAKQFRYNITRRLKPQISSIKKLITQDGFTVKPKENVRFLKK